MSQDPLDEPVSLRTLHRWRSEGLLDADTLGRAREMILPAASWQAWLRLELLLAGVALVLSGVIFFFAYNWQGMGRFEKLGLIQGALVLCIFGVWRLGLQTLGGQVLVLAATVMTGVFLAVFGQIYQTGADAYELFTGWAALTLVWVIATRMEALWFLWLVIVEAGVMLFWDQVAEPGWRWPSGWMFLLLAGINGTALVIRESVKSKAAHHWLRVTLVTALLAALVVPALDMILEGARGQSLPKAAVPVWLMVTAVTYYVFRFLRPDFACVALTAANAAVLVVCTFARLLFSGTGDEFVLYILMSLVIVAATAGLTMWLSREYKAMRKLPR